MNNSNPIEQTNDWFVTENPVLYYEQMAIETDSLKVKFGDGETSYVDIAYSGFIWRNNHLEVDTATTTPTAYKDTIIYDNEIVLKDRIIAGNSITIQEII